MARSISSQLMFLGFIFLVQKVDLQELGYINYTRAAFLTAQIFSFSLMLIIYKRIDQMESGGPTIHVPEVKQFGQEIKPKMTVPHQEYDFMKWKEQLQHMVIGCCVLAFIHGKWGYILPLVLQTIQAPWQALESPLFQIHIRKKAAVGELKRPFPSPNPFGLLSVAERASGGKIKKKFRKKDR